MDDAQSIDGPNPGARQHRGGAGLRRNDRVAGRQYRERLSAPHMPRDPETREAAELAATSTAAVPIAVAQNPNDPLLLVQIRAEAPLTHPLEVGAEQRIHLAHVGRAERIARQEF